MLQGMVKTELNVWRVQVKAPREATAYACYTAADANHKMKWTDNSLRRQATQQEKACNLKSQHL